MVFNPSTVNPSQIPQPETCKLYMPVLSHKLPSPPTHVQLSNHNVMVHAQTHCHVMSHAAGKYT